MKNDRRGEPLRSKDGKIMVILGPTGVGKTEASLRVAETIKTEIISADSMQIYRFMNIGTAKPTEDQLHRVPHHMISAVDPSDAFSTGRYIEAVLPVIEGLLAKGKVPLVVGGTGLYIKSMTRGLFSAPEADSGLREELLVIEREAPGSLYERLLKIDPVAAEKITAGDVRRIVRALEVCMKSDRPISELQKIHTQPLPYEFMKIGLTRERSELYAMIEARVDVMFASGLVDEVRSLLTRKPCYTAMQAIGYKEVAQHLRGEIGREEMVWSVKRASKRYAKRQYTWFRKEPDITWLDITGIHDGNEIGRMIETVYERLCGDHSPGDMSTPGILRSSI